MNSARQSRKVGALTLGNDASDSSQNGDNQMPALLTRYWKIAILWALSLVVVSALSSSAQTQRGGRPAPNLPTETPTVVSGSDVGFRIERTQDGIPVGKLVVRVDGRWVDTAPSR